MATKKYSLAAFSLALAFIACSDDSSSSSSNSEQTVDSDIVSIENKTVRGVSQKGPFLNGSSVTVQELNAHSLAQTGKSFEGKIKNDLGEFSVKIENLASQYVLLKVNGYYQNEVTGQKSGAPITLYALTDLSNRDQVNVNLLTHLEYERTLHLVENDSMSVADAKKQAEKEILESFSINGDFATAEDLNIFGTSEGNAALLAISVLMQCDLNEADFSERLANYAADMEADGKWSDAKTVTAIADWAQTKDLAGELVSIRSNVEKWNLGIVPEFEKFVRKFWYTNYGLGECGDENKAEVLNEYLCTKNGWASLIGGWSWDIPKEYRFNPSITYGTFTESAERGGQMYRIVTIGNEETSQTWMAENLNYYDESLKGRSWCYGAEGSENTTNCEVTGRLYTWAAAVGKTEEECGRDKNCNLQQSDLRGVCPPGWHLPTLGEWFRLYAIGGWHWPDVDKSFKSQTGWVDDENVNSGNGSDVYGFSALPAGYRSSDGLFDDAGYEAYFWTASEGNNRKAYASYSYPYADTAALNIDKGYGLSVRCIKD